MTPRRMHSLGHLTCYVFEDGRRQPEDTEAVSMADTQLLCMLLTVNSTTQF